MPETRGQKRKRDSAEWLADHNRLWSDLMEIDRVVEQFNTKHPDCEYTIIKK